MKILILVAAIFVSAQASASNMSWVPLAKKILKNHAEECKAAEISVTQIVRNSHIQGAVSGLKETSLENFRMIFYVYTNKWYVHPYQYHEHQTSGYSYSDLTSGGEFWIRSVLRTPAKRMVAVLVPAVHYIYNSQKKLSTLLKYSCAHIEIPGNGDFAP